MTNYKVTISAVSTVAQRTSDGAAKSVATANPTVFETLRVGRDSESQVFCVLRDGGAHPSGFSDGDQVHFLVADQANIAIAIV